MQRMLHSSKFWTFIVTQVLVLATYFVAKYAAPSAADDILIVLGFVEGVAAIVIAAILGEDAACWLSGGVPGPGPNIAD